MSELEKNQKPEEQKEERVRKNVPEDEVETIEELWDWLRKKGLMT